MVLNFSAVYAALAIVTRLRVLKSLSGNCKRDHMIDCENLDSCNCQAHNLLKIYQLLYLKGKRLDIYNLPYVYVYALSDMRRITLVLIP
jgi:hypothetical protein